MHCDDRWENLAEAAKCLDMINSLRDPKLPNDILPRGLKQMCGGRQANPSIKCCIAWEQNLTGTGTRYSDLVAAAFAVYTRCPQKAINGDHWLSGWTTDTLLGGQCGNQCLSSSDIC